MWCLVVQGPAWERHTIPGVAQIIAAYDVDKDGRKELIGIKGKRGESNFYNALSSDLVWLKLTAQAAISGKST